MEHKINTVLILTGGDLDYDYAEDFVKTYPIRYLIAADKGMEFCYRRNILPDAVLGDYDSIDPEIVTYYRNQTNIPMETFPSEKDDTDTEIALKRAIAMEPTQIYILGAFGGRQDHFIANLHLLNLALKKGISAWLVDGQNRITLIDKNQTIEKIEKDWKYISFLPFTDKVEGITLVGFKYGLDDYTMTKGSSIGVSNEAVSIPAQVKLESGTLIMIQSRDK